MATVYKIHPAIGIARVGNSPDEFFVGPERLGQPPTPQGGFKDAQCRVKRQAARFRIFAHHDDGTATEVTHAEADISWTVELANTKASNPGRGNSEPAAKLQIKPGPRTLSGPNQAAAFDTGTIAFDNAPVTTVPLGEVRSDPQNHLLVLGGAGTSASPAGTALDGFFWASDDWYDDVADGPVTATITLRADGSTPPVAGAWVLVAPPKFAPDQDSVITLYDRIRQAVVAGGLLPQPTTTSYTADIYPILQRARDTRGVEQTAGVHNWPDPVASPGQRAAIFAKLKNPVGGGGNMPAINDSGSNDDTLTREQYDHMQRWSTGNYANDWVGVPPPQTDVTPDGLDRAALDACVGGAFFPGIEAGGRPVDDRHIVDATKYAEPFRLDHAALQPGDLTYVMALPWQNDFYQCSSNWWPVPRPDYVTRGGVAGQLFTGGILSDAQGMVDKWHKLGFVVRQAAGLVEVERCDVASVSLLTTVLNFQHVPQGPMGMVRETALAITFEVSTPSAPVTLQYAPGGAPNHPQLVAYNSAVTVGPTTPTGVATARLWVIYRTSTPGDVLPPQTLVVGDGTSTWTVTVTGDTVGRRTVATALVLDRSASMAEDAGGGTTKHTLLQQAASIFVDTMLEGDGVAVVRFNEDAQVLENVVELGPGGLSDVGRNHTKDVINGSDLDPDGSTSIGDGIFEGRGALAAATSASDGKALVVLTDGVENQPRWIADVANDITESTYAVGLGQPQNISVSALQKISGNNGGYLLVTGPVGTDNRFLLQKYFLQILAGISNAEIALDPDGHLLPGRVERVPFQLVSGDAGVDVILLTPDPRVVDFRVETPSGQLLEPWRAPTEAGMRYVTSDGVAYFRIALPFEFQPDRFDVGGTWNAVLTLGRPRLERSGSRDGTDPSIRYAAAPAPRSAPVANTSAGRLRAARDAVLAAERGVTATPAAADTSDGVPYSVVVHTYSNLTFEAGVEQSGFEPGAEVRLSAALARSGIPFDGSAAVWAEVTLPFGRTFTVGMDDNGQGGYAGSFATEAVGVYLVRVRANGSTTRGEPFAREKTLSAAVWRGGDRGPDPQPDLRSGTP